MRLGKASLALRLAIADSLGHGTFEPGLRARSDDFQEFPDSHIANFVIHGSFLCDR
jgi:hypothetical protein